MKLSVDFVYAICEKVPIDCLKSQKFRVNESKTYIFICKITDFCEKHNKLLPEIHISYS